MKAADVMTEEVAICRTTDNLNRAAQLMWEGPCGCVPVLDEMETVVGMLTDRDVCMASYTQGKTLSQIPVTTAMARDVVTCYPSTPVDDVRELMEAHHIHRIPVVDGEGRLMGLVSRTDLAREAPVPGNKGIREVIRNSVEVLRTLRQELRADVTLAEEALRRPHGRSVNTSPRPRP